MSDGLKSILRKAAFAAALAIGLASGAAQAATLYISEFANAVGQVGTTVAQVQPQTAITDQAIGLSGSAATSAAFNAKTHAVMLMCDEGCSVNFSGSATTSNYLLQQGVAYRFVTVPAGTVSAIANSAGNVPGGASGTPTSVTIVGPLGQTTSAASIPVVPANDYYPASATYAHIAAGQATTVVKGTPGKLYSITFNSNATATNVTTVYDNATTSGLVVAIPAATSLSGQTLQFGPLGLTMTLGITIITTTANGADMTVAYH